MSAADDVADHIHSSLLDLRRRLDAETAITVARAMLDGAQRALHELGGDQAAPDENSAPRSSVPAGLILFGGAKH